jgi:hypothetical protein
MKIINSTQKLSGLAILASLALLSSACSDNKATTNSAEKSAPISAAKQDTNHHVAAGKGEAPEPVKNKFIKQFSNSCVERELKNSINKDVDQKRFEDSCGCIAKHIADDLSDLDAEKYLVAHEDTQSLDIKFDQAAYFCLQAKGLPKGPHLFGKE